MFIVYIVDLPLNTGDFPVRNVRGYPGLSDPHRSLGPGNDRSSTGATLARPRSGCYWDPALQQFESAPSTRNKKTWTKKNCSETFLVVFGKWRQCIIYIYHVYIIYIYMICIVYIYIYIYYYYYLSLYLWYVCIYITFPPMCEMISPCSSRVRSESININEPQDIPTEKRP